MMPLNTFEATTHVNHQTSRPMGLAVFVSGSGSNLQALIDAIEAGELKACIKMVVADNPCYGLRRAEAAGIPTRLIDRKDLKGLEASEQEVLWTALASELKEKGIQLLVLAGYLSIVPQVLVNAFPEAIINLHPSLIPKYCGKGFYGMKVHEAVIKAKETESGISIHYVDGGIDTGRLIKQVKVPVRPEDTPETLAEKIHALEHVHLKSVIAALIENQPTNG